MEKKKSWGCSTYIEKIDFKTKAIVRDKEGYYIMIRRTIQQEDITLVNIYAPNIGAPNYVKKVLTDIEGEIIRSIVVIGDFNTILTSTDRFSRQEVNKETEALINTLDQMDLIDIFRVFHPKAAEYTSFSSAHGTFSRIDHMLGHETSLNKFKKIEIISNIFSDHNDIKLEINHRKKPEIHTRTWRLSNMFLNNE